MHYLPEGLIIKRLESITPTATPVAVQGPSSDVDAIEFSTRTWLRPTDVQVTVEAYSSVCELLGAWERRVATAQRSRTMIEDEGRQEAIVKREEVECFIRGCIYKHGRQAWWASITHGGHNTVRVYLDRREQGGEWRFVLNRMKQKRIKRKERCGMDRSTESELDVGSRGGRRGEYIRSERRRKKKWYIPNDIQYGIQYVV